MMTLVHAWALLLVPLPLLLRWLLPPRRRGVATVRVPFLDRIERARGDGPLAARSARGARAAVGPALVWLLILAALARPQWLEPPVTRERPTRDLLLLVDLSSSMTAEDFLDPSGATVDRLDAVKGVLGDFLARREGDRVGLVVFGSAPFLQAPFSTDLSLAERLLNETAIGMAGPKTALGDAIGLGLTLFEDSDAPAKTIIALTDGNDTASQVPPAEAARVASARGVRIHTVAIGDPTTVGEQALDEEALRAVAHAASGSYFFAADREGLEGIYDELDRIETRKVEVVSHRPRRDLFQWPLLAALLLSLAGRLVPALRQQRRAPDLRTAARIRVHPRTGELEVQE